MLNTYITRYNRKKLVRFVDIEDMDYVDGYDFELLLSAKIFWAGKN